MSDPKNLYGVMFCGFGGSCSGAHQAGLEAAFAIDNNDRIKLPILNGEKLKSDEDAPEGWDKGKEGENWYWHERLPAIQTREKNFGDGKGLVMSVEEFKPTAKHAARYITASPPCKRFSSSAETWDENDIGLSEMDKFIKDLGKVAIRAALQVPEMEYYIMENVVGMLSESNHDHLVEMVTMLKDAGFTVEWAVFNAADLGCCQERERVILVASKSGRKGLLPAAPGVKRLCFADIMEDGKTKASKERLEKSRWSTSTYATARFKEERGAAKMKIIIPSRAQALKDKWDKATVNGCVDIMPTIACNAGGGPTRKKWMILDPKFKGFRNATLLEGLRAQGFEDAWLDNLPENEAQAWAMIGNAVARPMMFHIMNHLRQLDTFYDGKTKNLPASCKSLDESYVMKMPHDLRLKKEETAKISLVFS